MGIEHQEKMKETSDKVMLLYYAKISPSSFLFSLRTVFFNIDTRLAS
jgi:hypothetical protein